MLPKATRNFHENIFRFSSLWTVKLFSNPSSMISLLGCRHPLDVYNSPAMFNIQVMYIKQTQGPYGDKPRTFRKCSIKLPTSYSKLPCSASSTDNSQIVCISHLKSFLTAKQNLPDKRTVRDKESIYQCPAFSTRAWWWWLWWGGLASGSGEIPRKIDGILTWSIHYRFTGVQDSMPIFLAVKGPFPITCLLNKANSKLILHYTLI